MDLSHSMMLRYFGLSGCERTWLTGHQTGEQIDNRQVHELDNLITDLQWAPDRTYFITASRDKTARLINAADLEVMKTYVTDTPLNSAAITPRKDFVILGGGQDAMGVTQTVGFLNP